MKLCRIALERWTQQWADGEHGAYARQLLPVPTRDIVRLHETLKRPASSAIIQMQTGKIGLPVYLNTIQRQREEQLEANPLRNPARCSCEIGNQDTQHVLFTCPRFTDLRLRVLGLPHEREGITWKDWLTKPAPAVKAATLILKTRLLGQFRASETCEQGHRVCPVCACGPLLLQKSITCIVSTTREAHRRRRKERREAPCRAWPG